MSFEERERWIGMNDGARLDASVCTPEGNQPVDPDYGLGQALHDDLGGVPNPHRGGES